MRYNQFRKGRFCDLEIHEGGFAMRFFLALMLISIFCLLAGTEDNRLFTAISQGKVDDVKHALLQGADPEAINPDTGCTPLAAAVRTGNKDVVDLFFLIESNVNLKDKKGLTALYHAIAAKKIGMVKLLLDHKAKINEEDNSKVTPLMYAVDNDQLEITKLLIEKGADLNARDKNGTTALIYAVAQQKKEMVKLLLERGAFKHYVDNFGNDALKIATQLKNKEIIQLLTLRKDTTKPQQKDIQSLYLFK